MPGKRIKNQQVRLYMSYRKQGFNQIASAAKTGISERTGRKIEHGDIEQQPGRRQWRTRKDVFEQVWDSDIVPLLSNNADLSPLTLLEHLQDKYPNQYPDKLLRTLQRRVKAWRAEYGPSKEAMFQQDYPPGKQGLSDFTVLKGVTITIAGEPLAHLLYHFRLRYSGWSHMKVVLGGESYTALAEGLQEALWRLGGSPTEHRTDSLSAAFRNLSDDEKVDVTNRYDQFCQHYKMEPTRNNRGRSHENGAIESPHGHLKRRILQALTLRGSPDFETLEDYQTFIDKVVCQHNRRNAKAIDVERPYLQYLPEHKTTDYTEISAKVSGSSTINVRHATYTVPSRLIGECLRIHLYHDRLQCYLGAKHLLSLKRVYSNHRRGRNIDYRHVYESLLRKPGAFRHSALRDDLLPTPAYRQIWEVANAQLESQMACRYIVGCLALAARFDCERRLSDFILNCLSVGVLPSLSELQDQFGKSSTQLPQVEVKQHSLMSYDQLGGDSCTA